MKVLPVEVYWAVSLLRLASPQLPLLRKHPLAALQEAGFGKLKPDVPALWLEYFAGELHSPVDRIRDPLRKRGFVLRPSSGVARDHCDSEIGHIVIEPAGFTKDNFDIYCGERGIGLRKDPCDIRC